MTAKEQARQKARGSVDPETVNRLRAISERVREMQAQLRPLEDERNALVRQALAEGWTHQQISDTTGLSRGRIGQIRATFA
jgi:DNA-directed RNA polymerase specialized sigma24 family protein